MSYSANLKVDAGSNVYLKTPPGSTKVRVVSDIIPIWKDFDGKKNYLTEEGAKSNSNAKPRYCVWTIDRADGLVKMWEFSGGMARDLQALSENPEYAFSGSFPYDIIISRIGTTQLDTRYTVGAARENTELTAEEIKKINDMGFLLDFLKKDAEDASEAVPF